MKIRAVAASAIAIAAALTVSGCSMLSPQRTTLEYDASDGVSVDLGDIQVRNVLLLADAEGANANLVFAGLNETGNDAQVQAAVAGNTVSVQLGSGQESLTQVGYGEGGPELVTGDFASGTTVPVTFTATYTDRDGNQQTMESTAQVPVLGDADAASVLDEYETLVPTQEPTHTSAATDEPSETTEGDATPAASEEPGA